MQSSTFVDLLSDIRRKSQITGRPLTKNETAGAIAGQEEGANERLSRGRQLKLQESELAMRTYENSRTMKAQERTAKVAQSQKQKSSAVTGGMVGGYLAAGTAVGGPIGAVLGAAVGFLIGDCIIITACTSRDAYEVNIARMYRDNNMNIHELLGYYALAYYIVPIIERFKPVKMLTKKLLVDSLVDYGEWHMSLKPKMKHPIMSKLISVMFLKLCENYGLRINSKLKERLDNA